jgi:hypothetical protein
MIAGHFVIPEVCPVLWNNGTRETIFKTITGKHFENP